MTSEFDKTFPYRAMLDSPVIGMESDFTASQAVFRRESDGQEQMLSIDQLQNMNRWIS